MSLAQRASVSSTRVSGVPHVPADRTHTSKYCDVCYGVGKSFEEYTSHYVKSKVGPDGVVTCPTILNSICTYCKKKGHFKSACEVLKKKNKMGGGSGSGAQGVVAKGVDSAKKELIHLVQNYKSDTKKRQRDGNLIHKNTFDCLFIGDDGSDHESEDDSEHDNDCDFPPIPPPLVRSQTNKKPDRVIVTSFKKKMSYADALESAAKTFPSAVASAKATVAAADASSSSAANTPYTTLSNSAGVSLLAYVNNTPPPFVTTRKYNANGTRKSWADYSDSDTDSDCDEED
jgi:hypothetical protein